MVQVSWSILLLALTVVVNANAYLRAVRGRATAHASNGTITTIAGIEPNGGSAWLSFSGDGGPAVAAALNYPSGLALDSSGQLYIADRYNYRVRVVSRDSTIVTIAGAGGYTTSGLPATSFQLRDPIGVAVDGSGNLFIVDEVLLLVIRVDRVTKIATVVAGGGRAYAGLGDGGPATAAALNDPSSVAVDRHGNLIVTESSTNRVRFIASNSSRITTIAGNGTAGYTGDGGPPTAALVSFPRGVAIDPVSGDVYVVDVDNYAIRVIAADLSTISTYAGGGGAGSTGDGGPATLAQLTLPYAVAVGGGGDVYIADAGARVVRVVTRASRVISTVAGGGSAQGASGDGGPATAAALNFPRALAVASDGTLFIADAGDSVVRAVAPPSASASTTATPSATLSMGASPSATPTAPVRFPVLPLVVDGPAVSGFVVAGQTLFYAYSQPLPYGVTLTLTSVTGDADLFVGPAPPDPVSGAFNFTASSTASEGEVDYIACLSRAPAVSASGGTGAVGPGNATSSCWGPAASSTWIVQVSGWTAASFSLTAVSNRADPLGVGSPQPTPGAIGATLALGVTAVGTLIAEGEVVYWALTPPHAVWVSRIHVNLRVTSQPPSDADLLVGVTPPYGSGDAMFNSSWASTNTGDDDVTLPASGGARTFYICVKAFTAPLSFALLAETTVPSPSPTPCCGYGGGGGSSSSDFNVAFAIPLCFGAVFAIVVCAACFAKAKQSLCARDGGPARPRADAAVPATTVTAAAAAAAAVAQEATAAPQQREQRVTRATGTFITPPLPSAPLPPRPARNLHAAAPAAPPAPQPFDDPTALTMGTNLMAPPPTTPGGSGGRPGAAAGARGWRAARAPAAVAGGTISNGRGGGGGRGRYSGEEPGAPVDEE